MAEKQGRRVRLHGLAAAARHEAGHAVAALACGLNVIGVVANETRGLAGHASPTKADPMIEGIIAWAGSVAEGVTGISPDDAAVFTKYHFTNRSIATLRLLAEGLLQEHEAAVSAVAAELTTTGSVFGPDVRRIAIAASPTLKRDAPRYPRADLPTYKAAFERMCRKCGVKVKQ